ncbi:MAG: YceI family protein [Sulfuricella sp.]|nr:YceI family protein [Sulfuricella sp.]
MNKLPALLLAILPLTAQAAEYASVLTDKSAVTFVSKQMNVPVEGKFRKFAAQLNFDPAKPEAAHAQIDIELASIDAGSNEANDEVKSKAWFNVKEFPAARFVSAGLKALGGGRFEATGKLTIKGRSRDVTAPFTFKQEGANAVLDGAFTLKRLQYGIGEGMWSDTDTVADDVQIRFHILAAPKK